MSSADNASLPSSPRANGSSPADARSRRVRRGGVPRTVARVWRDYQWWVVALAAVAAFVLGVAGFLHHDPSPTDAVYNSLKLFVFHLGEANTGVGVCLNIARFLAPAVAGYAALVALGSLFYERWLLLQVPRRRGHIVLCGLGYVGNAFLESLHHAGKRVVVIEKDAESPNRRLCREMGVPVIVGDAQQLRILQAAGIERAARLLAVTPDDAVNTEIIARAQESTSPTPEQGQRRQRTVLTHRRGGNLRCLAQIGDPDLCLWLRIEESKRHDAESTLDFFNPDEISARLLLDEFPFDDTCERPHILVTHLDGRGARLIFHAARQWYDHRRDNTVPLLVTVVDDHAEQEIDALLGQYPVLESEKVCEFTPCSVSVRSIQRRLATEAPKISRAYVTAYDDAHALETALKLRREFDALDAKVPLVLALSGAEGVASLVAGSSVPDMEVFPTLQQTCNADFAEGGSFETVARAIHARYGDIQAGKTKPPVWSELSESFKESNRSQARHIEIKLNAVGCQIVPLRDWGAMDFTFTDEEVERLAEMEHTRWWDERRADGWTLGEQRDEKLKKNPYMVEWNELTPDIADLDREFVKAIPALLASVGLQVVRVPTT